jgi:hypothetical protein
MGGMRGQPNGAVVSTIRLIGGVARRTLEHCEIETTTMGAFFTEGNGS